MKRRNTGGFELSPQAQAVVDDYAKKRSMLKKDLVQRVMLWFSRQPAAVKRVAILDVDEGMEVKYAESLEAMAQDLRVSAKSGSPTVAVVPPVSGQSPPLPSPRPPRAKDAHGG